MSVRSEPDSRENDKLAYIEFKNHKPEGIAHLPLNQLKSYFHAAQSISEMKYVFNKLDTPNISDIKKQMQKAFEKNADEIFKPMNQNMKASLKISSTDGLLDLIDDISSPLYSFIGIQ